MSETVGPHSGMPLGDLLPEGREGAFGRVLPGMEFRIVDPDSGAPMPTGAFGELLVRGRWLMDGFYKRERSEVFEPDGFYRTGDNCALDDEGFLYFSGRLGGMIKTSGANVSPEEVEILVRSHPDVLEAAVFGVPDRRVGQIVVAAVAKVQGAALDEAELQAFLRGQLSSFKTPKRIIFVDFEELPRTASQKIRKAELAALFAGRLGA
jgi:acyl-CoA synthetase (AMP-forming)/AMP-acid ligase II